MMDGKTGCPMRRILLAAFALAGFGPAASAGIYSGRTLRLDAVSAQPNVTIEAFEVSLAGAVSGAPFARSFSDASGVYSIDLGTVQRVVLRFSRNGRTVFVPNPPDGNNNGGAISGTQTVANFDVIVPDPDVVRPTCPPYYHYHYYCARGCYHCYAARPRHCWGRR